MANGAKGAGDSGVKPKTVIAAVVAAVILVVGLWLVFSSGAGEARRARLRYELHSLGMAFHLHHDAHGRGPADLAAAREFAAVSSFRDGSESHLDIVEEMLNEGRLEVAWNGVFHLNEPNPPYRYTERFIAREVLDADAKTGWVVMGGGELVERSRDELAALEPLLPAAR